MTSRVLLPWRQWHRFTFVGAAARRKKTKECSFLVGSVATLSSSAVRTRSHRRINPLSSSSTRQRGKDVDAHSCLAMGLLLPRTLSTTPSWYAPTNKNTITTPLSQQQQQEKQQEKQQQPPLPSPSASSLPQRDGNQHGPKQHDPKQKNVVALYPNLEARTGHLKDVAIGKVTDKTVRLEDYFEALEAWRELAREIHREHMKSLPGGIPAARRARALLKALEHNLEPRRKKSTVLRPTASFYNVVLQAYAVSGGGQVAATKAEELLDHMLANARAALHERPPRLTAVIPEPSIESYYIVMNCWAKTKCKDSGIRAERVLTRMDEWRRDCHVALQNDPSFPYQGCYPTTDIVCSLIYALAGSRDTNALDRALQLMKEVAEAQRITSIPKHRFQKVRLKPDWIHSVIASWLRTGQGREAASKAEELLSFAVKVHEEGLMKKLPSNHSYALVLDAWAMCEDSTGYCAQRVHDILVNMIRLYRQGVSIGFNFVSIGTCVAAWSKCANLPDSPEKAESILQELLSLHEETGLGEFQPDILLWHSLQTVWVNATERTESMDQCVEILQRMQKHGCQPTTSSYRNVLLAAGRRGFGNRALALLQQYALHSKVLRDILCLNAVLEALTREARDDSMDRAMEFFEKMKCQDIYAKPDAQSYTILLDALSRSEGCQHAERARNLLEEMLQRFQQGDQSCRPDASVVSIVLKVCGCTNGTDDDRRQARGIALDIFRKCESYFGVTPNHLVYSAMLDAIICLAGVSKAQRSERLELLEEVFEECQAKGYVSDAVVTVMRQGGANHCLIRLNAYSCRRVELQDRPTIAGVPVKSRIPRKRRSVRMARAGLY